MPVSPTETKDEELKQDQLKTEESSTSDTDQDTEDSSDPNPTEELSTFDVVMNAIKPEGDKDGGSSEEDKSKKTEAEKKAKDNKDKTDDFEDFSPDERKQLKKATAERFDKLKGLYHESKEKVTQLTAQVEQATVEAGYYRKFVGFLDENRLSQEDANNLFHIGALMRNDPAKALEVITPYYQSLLQMTGSVLPPDLQQQVTQGYITKEAALELSRHRASGQTNQVIQRERESYQQQQELTRQQKTVASMQTAVADWEKQWSSSDPDYAKKKDRVLDRVELLLVRAQKNGSLPKTVEEAVKLANQAKSEIETDLKQFKPRREVKTVDGGSSISNLPDAKNTADVIRRTLNQ